MNLSVQAGVVFLEGLYAALLAAEGESRLHPAYDAVFLEEKEQHEYCSDHDRETGEGALRRPVPVLAAVPYLIKFSHNHKNS